MASTRFQLALQPVLFVVLLFHAVGCQNTSVSKEHGAGTTLVSAKEPNDSIKALRSSFRETTQTHASRIYRKKLGTERPAWIFAPQGKGAKGPLPHLLLHGYGDTASGLTKAWQFERLVRNGQAYLLPMVDVIVVVGNSGALPMHVATLTLPTIAIAPISKG